MSMFNGIVETTGKITRFEKEQGCIYLSVLPEIPFLDLKIGDSVSVNGVCLTVVDIHDNAFDMTIVNETLRVTNLGYLNKNSIINLERSIKCSDRISGHYVQGHVDCVGTITQINNPSEGSVIITTQFPSRFKKYIVNKGYIALDGMSITVIEVTDNTFTITLIPHTKKITVAKNYHINSKINLEFDILSKYVENIMRASQ